MTGRTYKQYQVQDSWWEALSWWISRLQWSQTGMCNTTQHKDTCRISWLELLLLFQLQAGFRFPAKDLDLASMERLFRVLCTRAVKACHFRQGGTKFTMQEVFRPANTVTSLRHILGHHRPGICRRPLATNEHWARIVTICIKAKQKCNTLIGYGQGFRLQLPLGKGSLWQPQLVTEAEEVIASRHGQHKFEQTDLTVYKHKIKKLSVK